MAEYNPGLERSYQNWREDSSASLVPAPRVTSKDIGDLVTKATGRAPLTAQQMGLSGGAYSHQIPSTALANQAQQRAGGASRAMQIGSTLAGALSPLTPSLRSEGGVKWNPDTGTFGQDVGLGYSVPFTDIGFNIPGTSGFMDLNKTGGLSGRENYQGRSREADQSITQAPEAPQAPSPGVPSPVVSGLGGGSSRPLQPQYYYPSFYRGR